MRSGCFYYKTNIKLVLGAGNRRKTALKEIINQ